MVSATYIYIISAFSEDVSANECAMLPLCRAGRRYRLPIAKRQVPRQHRRSVALTAAPSRAPHTHGSAQTPQTEPKTGIRAQTGIRAADSGAATVAFPHAHGGAGPRPVPNPATAADCWVAPGPPTHPPTHHPPTIHPQGCSNRRSARRSTTHHPPMGGPPTHPCLQTSTGKQVSIYPSTHPTTHPSTHPPTDPPTDPPTHLSIPTCLPVSTGRQVSFYLLIHPPTHPPARPIVPTRIDRSRLFRRGFVHDSAHQSQPSQARFQTRPTPDP